MHTTVLREVFGAGGQRVPGMGRETQPLLDWIEEYRRRRGWNYSEFARAAGVEPSVLSRWFNGRVRPRTEVLRRMAQRLGVDEEELYVLAGYRQTMSEEDPATATLVAKLRLVPMTPDRFRILEVLLDELRQTDPEA